MYLALSSFSLLGTKSAVRRAVAHDCKGPPHQKDVVIVVEGHSGGVSRPSQPEDREHTREKRYAKSEWLAFYVENWAVVNESRLCS